MSQIGRSLLEQRKREQDRGLWENIEKQYVAEVMRLRGVIARAEDELIEAERALENHRGKKV